MRCRSNVITIEYYPATVECTWVQSEEIHPNGRMKQRGAGFDMPEQDVAANALSLNMKITFIFYPQYDFDNGTSLRRVGDKRDDDAMFLLLLAIN
jgi:hypothetical protein